MKVSTVKNISKYSIIVAALLNLIALSYYYGAVKPRTEIAAQALYDQRDFKNGIDFIYEEMGELIKNNTTLDSILLSGEKIVLPYDLYPGVKKQLDAKVAESGLIGLTTMKERINPNDSLKVREFECVGVGNYSAISTFVRSLELSGVAIEVEKILINPFTQGFIRPQLSFVLRASIPYTDILLRDSIIYRKPKRLSNNEKFSEIAFSEQVDRSTADIELSRIKQTGFRNNIAVLTDEFDKKHTVPPGAQVKNGFFIGTDTEKETLRFFIITNSNPLSYSIVELPYKN